MGIGLGYQSGKKALAAVAPVRAICAAAGGTTLASDCTVDGVIILSEAVSAAAAGSQKASIIGMSASADMGNGFSVVANYSRKSDETVRETVDSATTVLVDADGDDSSVTVAHTAIGIAYSVGDITVGVNGGTSTTKTTEIRWDTTATAAVSTTSEEKAKRHRCRGGLQPRHRCVLPGRRWLRQDR